MLKRLILSVILASSLVTNAVQAGFILKRPQTPDLPKVYEKQLHHNWTTMMQSFDLQKESLNYLMQHLTDKVVAEVQGSDTECCLIYYFTSPYEARERFARYGFPDPVAKVLISANKAIERLLQLSHTAHAALTQGRPGLSGACRFLLHFISKQKPAPTDIERGAYFTLTYTAALKHLIQEADLHDGVLSDPTERIMLFTILYQSNALFWKPF